jgi:Ca2+-binding RTX toxin-like protein
MAVRYGTSLDEALFGDSGNDSIYAFGGNDYLYGYAGNDLLDGGAGADAMYGGTGDDWFYVENADDNVVEYAGQGYDAVWSSIDYTLGNNLEVLVLRGSSHLDGTGNALNNELYGNSGDNTLNGLDGNDTLYGGSGNDRLIGGIGADILEGGAGNDTYDVDNAGDVVTESASQGYDWVFSSTSFTLGDNVESLVLDGSGHLGGAGNGLDNEIYGNDGNNTLRGLGGNDNLYGGHGNDNLIGGAGADGMYGWTGDDWYYVDDAGDRVVEYADRGYDAVFSTIDYTLGDNVEVLVLQGTGAIDGTGNALDNELYGNEAGNDLVAGLGDDQLSGHGGDDALYGQTGNDLLKGDGGNDHLFGGSGNDTLNGGAGNDVLQGDSGYDVATGGKGFDTFIFNELMSTDQITDFERGLDLIDLSMVDARSDASGNQSFDYIGGGNFTGVSGQLHFKNGYVEGDVNGDAVADFSIQVLNVTGLSASDFYL